MSFDACRHVCVFVRDCWCVYPCPCICMCVFVPVCVFVWAVQSTKVNFLALKMKLELGGHPYKLYRYV